VTPSPPLARRSNTLSSSLGLGEKLFASSEERKFAVAIEEEALPLGLIPKAVPIRPLRSHEYPSPAPRPPFSVLDASATRAAVGGPVEHWRVNLRRMLLGVARG